MDDVLDGVSEGVVVVDDDWRVTRANAAATTLLDREDAALVGADVRDVFPQSVESGFHDRFGGDDAEPATASFEEYFPDVGAWLAVRTVDGSDSDGDVDDGDLNEPDSDVDGGGLVVYLRDVTERRDLEKALADREAELARVGRINATIQEIIRELVGATTREEVEETVCRRLVASDLYEVTWIGERDPAGDRLVHRTAAGESEGLVDRLVGTADPSDVPDEHDPDTGDAPDGPGVPAAAEVPEHTVVRTGETRLVRRLVEDDSVPEPLRRVAFARGLQSAIAVPLRYGSTTYGVLGVYASRPDAFTERERESLETLGVATGFVINAARQRNLLLSDTVVELTFRVTDPEDALVAASSRLDCSLTVEGIVPLADGALLCYVGVEGASVEDVLATARDRATVGDTRVVHGPAVEAEAEDETETEGGLVEVTLTGPSPLVSLAERGATVATATFEAGVGRLVAVVSPDEDVRALVEAMGDGFDGIELLAKRERHRSVETAQEFRSSLDERLTARQRTALRVAYHGGYFESPRDSTAEELAEGLGISSPTLHYHLRAAQSKLVDAFLDETPGGERRRSGDRDEWHDAAGDG